MSRVIKFRAWDVSGNEWYVNPMTLANIAQSAHKISWLEGLVWMQFTGLLDKNGKEIYEGDIVKIPAPTMDVLCEVKWDERRAAFEHAYGEVIGNIYENPELLSV